MGDFRQGDLVYARGHAGTWIIDSLGQGRALLENVADGHRLAAQTAHLTLLRRGELPARDVPETVTEEPELFGQ